MKTRKRLIAMIMAAALALSMITPGFAAYEEGMAVDSYETEPTAELAAAFSGISPLSSVLVGDETELRNAVTNAVGPTTIELTANIALTTGFLYIPSGSDITLTGNYALSVTGNTSVIDNRGTLTLDGITISGGSSNTGGGGVRNYGTLNMLSGEISGNNATGFWQHGGGVFNSSVFNMYGGTISSNAVAAAIGAGVYNSGTFTMNGGTISNNNAGWGGGGVASSGSFTMTGGAISDNTAVMSVGGGVYNNGTFTMHSGIISGNTAPDNGGGGVRNGDGTFILHGGTIIGNTSWSGGGVSNATPGFVYIYGGTISNNITNNYAGIGNHGTLTMNGGIISGNTALVSDGGGVGNSGAGANFTMNGGTITNNTANNNGGGVLSTIPNPSFIMNNGLISDNSATNGDGVYVALFNSGTNIHNGGIVTDNTVRFTVGTHVALITILTQPQLAYTAGDALNLNALVVRLTLGNGSTQDVAFADFGANGLTASPANGTALAAAHNGNPVVITYPVNGVTGNTGNLTVTAPTTGGVWGGGTPAPTTPPAPTAEDADDDDTEQERVNPFEDVSYYDWFFDAVLHAWENDLKVGTSADPMLFSPNATLTRAMTVTVLWRMAGEPSAAGLPNPFADVADGTWYNTAVRWAAANDIVSGVGDGRFAPGGNITREQMVTILWRYSQWAGIDVSVGEDTNILSYNDAFDISEFAIAAFQWACGAGVITGRPGGYLDPQGTATRAEFATVLMNFMDVTEGELEDYNEGE